MPDKNTILLLQLVNAKTDVEALVRRGLRYSQIGELFDRAINDGIIFFDGKDYQLTDKGKEIITGDFSTKQRRTLGGWISPDEESRIEKIDKFDIYLPKVENSHFK